MAKVTITLEDSDGGVILVMESVPRVDLAEELTEAQIVGASLCEFVQSGVLGECHDLSMGSKEVH